MRLQKNQHGLVLVFTLIIVLVLTLSVVAGLRDSVNNQKMITSSKSYQYAFEVAEAATLEVYDLIDKFTLNDLTKFGVAKGYLDRTQDVNPFNKTNWQNNSLPKVLPNKLAETHPPTYFIQFMNKITKRDTGSLAVGSYEDIDLVKEAYVFRVVVQATDENGQSRQVIETFYAREFQ